ncbi:MAG: hypothetical protein ABMA02_12880 [Saprospiraceae bacterium]
MTIEIVLQIDRPDDLPALISFLEKSGIAFRRRTKNKSRKTNSGGVPTLTSGKSATLGKYIGSMTNLNAVDFEQYLQKTREEWERDIF